MLVLLLEDDDLKRDHIARFLRAEAPAVDVQVAKSVHSGVRAIVTARADLIVLDMTMPAFDPSADEDGGSIKHYGGRDVLRQMEARGIVTPVVVVTQFDKFGDGDRALTLAQLDRQLRAIHPNYLGSVQYRAEVEGWKDALREKVGPILARNE